MLYGKVYSPVVNLFGNQENDKEISMYLMDLAIGHLAYEA